LDISLDPSGVQSVTFFDQDKSLPPMNGPPPATREEVEAIIRARVAEELKAERR
jgi:hypothetical protein